MKPRQRELLAASAEAMHEGAELWRDVADLMTLVVPEMVKVRDAFRETPGSEELVASLTDLLLQFKKLTGNSDAMSDRFAEIAAQLHPYRKKADGA